MKQIIWSSEDRLDDNARERYQEFQREVQDDNTYIVSDEEWADEVYGYLDDERHNLNKHIDGVIMVFADLGLWYGRRQGATKYWAAISPTYCTPNVMKPSGTVTATIFGDA